MSTQPPSYQSDLAASYIKEIAELKVQNTRLLAILEHMQTMLEHMILKGTTAAIPVGVPVTHTSATNTSATSHVSSPTTSKSGVHRIYDELSVCQATIENLEKIQDTYETDDDYASALASLEALMRQLDLERKCIEKRHRSIGANISATWPPVQPTPMDQGPPDQGPQGPPEQAPPTPPDQAPPPKQPIINLFGQESVAHMTRECIISTLDDCLRAWPEDITSAAKLAITRTALQIYGNPAHPENRTCRHEKELGCTWLLAHTEQGRWEMRPHDQVIDQIGQRAIDCLVGIHPLERHERKTGYLHIIGHLQNSRYHSDAYEKMFDQIARALWFDTQPR